MRGTLFARKGRRQSPTPIVCPNGNTRLDHQFDHWAVKISMRNHSCSFSYSPPPSPRLVSSVSTVLPSCNPDRAISSTGDESQPCCELKSWTHTAKSLWLIPTLNSNLTTTLPLPPCGVPLVSPLASLNDALIIHPQLTPQYRIHVLPTANSL